MGSGGRAPLRGLAKRKRNVKFVDNFQRNFKELMGSYGDGTVKLYIHVIRKKEIKMGA